MKLSQDEKAAAKRLGDLISVKSGASATLTPDEKAFIETFCAAHCRTRQEVMALRVSRFLAERTNAMMADDAGFALAAASQDLISQDSQNRGKNKQNATDSVDSGSDSGNPVKSGPESPDEEVVFRFESDEEDAWRVAVTVPPRAGAATELAIAVEGCDGGEGLLELAGVPLVVQCGKAVMPFGMFLAGIRDTNVALTPAGAARKPGHLAFF